MYRKIQTMNNKNKQNIGIVAVMILLAAATRLMPHPPNMTAIGAMGLFGAAYLNKKYLAFLVPFIALWITDLAINNILYAQFYDHFVLMGSVWTYIGFGAIVLFGMGWFKKINWKTVVGGSLSASAIFFFISNFGVWASGTMYPMNFAGLGACFSAGLPFLLNTVVGDLFFCGVLFGVYEYFFHNKFTTHPAVDILDA